jgi:hypothetical protein
VKTNVTNNSNESIIDLILLLLRLLVDVLNDEGRQIATGKTDEEYQYYLATLFEESNRSFEQCTNEESLESIF